MKQWICGANPQLKFTDKGMAYNLNAQTFLATQTSVFLASIYGSCLQVYTFHTWCCWPRTAVCACEIASQNDTQPV
jgi:hypothetical protein